MSLKQSREHAGRMCLVCGEAAGRKTVCGRCSPRRGTRAHADKYAATPTNGNRAGKFRLHHSEETTNEKTTSPLEAP